MSTLTTRIGGYKIVIRPATAEEKMTFADDSWNLFQREVDPSNAHVATFVDENGEPQSFDLPYELRGRIFTVNPTTILDVLAEHVETLKVRVNYSIGFCECFRAEKTCDTCAIESALHAREFSPLRGHGWETKYNRIKFSR